MVTPQDAEALLRGVDLRVTRPRLAVLTAVHDHPHSDTETIIRAVRRERIAEVSVQAVYDVLKALTTAGLVRRIESAGSVSLYEAQTGSNHQHVVCRTCGKVADVDPSVDVLTGLQFPKAHGFVIDEAEVVFRGLCSTCSNQNI